MEHRYTERKSMALDVVVSCSRVGLVRGRALNIGSGGMFVETRCVLMPVNSPVSVCFQPDPEQPSVNHEAEGMIVHQKGNGFGIMFGELKPETRSAINFLMVGGQGAGTYPGYFSEVVSTV